MDPKEWDKRLNRLLALLERFAGQQAQPPVINVNVNVGGDNEPDGDDETGRRRRAVSSSTSNDVPRPGGMPRPWVS